MKNFSSLLNRFALTIAGALALGACNRSEYAMLPKSASYLGTTPVASTPRPAAPVATQPQAAPISAPTAQAAPAEAPATPKAVAVAPVAAPTPAAAPVVAATPAPAEAATVATPATAPKLNLVQRLALKKISKKLDKIAANSPQFKQRDAAASTARLDSNLRTGIILIVVGLLLSLFSGVAGIFGVIGAIIAVIGLIFILLWLIDQA